MTKEQKKKFVRYAEGAEIYGMSLRKFQDFAKEAGAIHKVGKMVLVSCDIIDKPELFMIIHFIAAKAA